MCCNGAHRIDVFVLQTVELTAACDAGAILGSVLDRSAVRRPDIPIFIEPPDVGEELIEFGIGIPQKSCILVSLRIDVAARIGSGGRNVISIHFVRHIYCPG